MNKKTLISYFAEHRVAANILMALMLLSGIWAISKLNTQFLPNFKLDVITVTIPWPGASAEDVESAVIIPIEQELESINFVKEINSTAREGVAIVNIEFIEGTDIGQALDEVKQQVSLVRNLPEDTEKAEIIKVERYEQIARLILTGPTDLEQLRRIAHEFKRQLLEKGIAKVTLVGLPEKEIAIQVPSEQLFALNQSHPQIAQQILDASQTLPAGTAGRDELGHSLRSPGKFVTPNKFASIQLETTQQKRVSLGEISTITPRPQLNEVELLYQGQPAVELVLQRTESADSLKSAKILDQWLLDTQAKVGQSLTMIVYDQAWKPIWERISLLIKNGIGGLFLILITLFLFLEHRVAFWVAIGIPVSFAAALAVLYFSGGSINMVSLFALIMSLGIIVDDTIVVGENAYANMQAGQKPDVATIQAGHRMLAPVMASSLTTIAAFLPLMLISGIIGNILFDIPFVVICVILTSIIECFLVLPGHIRHSFAKSSTFKIPKLDNIRERLDAHFNRFRDFTFHHYVKSCLDNKWTTIAAMFSSLILVIALTVSGRIGFQFFPTPDSGVIRANIQFSAGTPDLQVATFTQQVEKALYETVREYSEDGSILLSAITSLRQSVSAENSSSTGQEFSSINIELVSPDSRNVSNQEFIDSWRSKLTTPPGLEKITIFSQRGGPPGKDIEIDLIGTSTKTLKQAAMSLQQSLQSYTGVYNIEDNLPYGKPELVYQITPQAQTLGLTTQGIGRQLRAAFDGKIVQIVNDDEDEVEIRVVLPDEERDNLNTLQFLPIQTPNGNMVPLGVVADFIEQKGLASIRHTDGQLAVRVTAEVDFSESNANNIIALLEETTLHDLVKDYGIIYKLKGKSEDQAQTFSDMGKGVVLAIILIYLVLAWVFSSYTTPLLVMAILPFGITGAILGHWVMNIDLTLLSFFGFFGLSGIIVNDSIILVSFYQTLRKNGVKIKKAILLASKQRLRAVLLTSLTTIAGLTPLLFETSLQAQFLIPMAVSITFGLAFGTVLILVMVPVLLHWQEQIHVGWRYKKRLKKST